MTQGPTDDPAAATPEAPQPESVPAGDDDAWLARLRGALGDDDALLALLRDAAPLPVKSAAVMELQGEAALRSAERELRDQDRSLHRLARQRHEQASARRHAREQAAALIAEARAQADAAVVTPEQLVELDRRWQALDARLLDAAQREDYAALMAGLGERSHAAPPPSPAPADAPAAAGPPPAPRPKPAARRPAPPRPDAAVDPELDAELRATEAALADGHLAQAAPHLAAIARRLDAGLPLPAPLRERIGALQAEYARLAAWRQWSGSRARDELLQQALALATPAAGPGQGPKLPLPQRAELITELRARWKSLDKQGTHAPRNLWQRFDAALTTAYRPVAEHAAAQRAAREHNRLERERLLAALEALPLPAEGAPPDEWRALAGAIDHFHSDWRRLGPLEHSVGRAQREPLASRLDAALQRLQAPLQTVRDAARAERERLLARARNLADEGPGRDWMARVRELQAEWQRQARSLPLARTDEQALWNDFRSAIDGAFAAREAAFKARDAEHQALEQRRTDCVTRLEALPEDLPAARIKQALAEADAQWRQLNATARRAAPGEQARFERAHDRLRRRLADQAQQDWLATCEALEAKLSLCESLDGDAAPAPDGDELARRWASWPALPAPLEQALAGRAGLSKPAPAAPPAATDDLLLQLEDRWAVPTPAAFAATRQALKLQQLKAALESRRTVAPPAPPAALLSALLGRRGLDAAQRERLLALLAALKRRGRDALA